MQKKKILHQEVFHFNITRASGKQKKTMEMNYFKSEVQ